MVYPTRDKWHACSNNDWTYAKLALKDNPKNREAKMILSYLDYEDNMLAAAFWEEDSEAMSYLAYRHSP